MGTVVVSLDAELAWGFHDVIGPPRQRFVDARYAWRRLLGLLDDYGIPATWSVVGHLFLEDCDGRHADHPTPSGWFPCPSHRDASGREVWYGDGLVAAIADAEVDHEIGCHTFSHVPFGESWVTERIVDAELRASLEAAAESGLAASGFRSFTYPRNEVGYRNLLAERGFTCYRGRQPPWWYDALPVPLRQVGKLADLTVARTTPPIVYPRIDEYGLVNLPASLYLFIFEGRWRTALESVRPDPVVTLAMRGIDRVADGDGIFHVWLHPNDYVGERDLERVETVLAHVDRRRAETDLAVRTMGEVAEEVRAGQTESATAK